MSLLITSSAHLTTEISAGLLAVKVVVHLYGNCTVPQTLNAHWTGALNVWVIKLTWMLVIIAVHRSQTKAETLLYFNCGFADLKYILFVVIEQLFFCYKQEENNSPDHAGEVFAPLSTLKCLFHMHSQQQYFSTLATIPKLSAETSNLLLWIT